MHVEGYKVLRLRAYLTEASQMMFAPILGPYRIIVFHSRYNIECPSADTLSNLTHGPME